MEKKFCFRKVSGSPSVLSVLEGKSKSNEAKMAPRGF